MGYVRCKVCWKVTSLNSDFQFKMHNVLLEFWLQTRSCNGSEVTTQCCFFRRLYPPQEIVLISHSTIELGIVASFASFIF